MRGSALHQVQRGGKFPCRADLAHDQNALAIEHRKVNRHAGDAVELLHRVDGDAVDVHAPENRAAKAEELQSKPVAATALVLFQQVGRAHGRQQSMCRARRDVEAACDLADGEDVIADREAVKNAHHLVKRFDAFFGGRFLHVGSFVTLARFPDSRRVALNPWVGAADCTILVVLP